MVSMPMSSLFRPFQLKSLRLPNRIVMAPMTRSFSPDGIPTDRVAAYYRRRAEGAVGLIITEGTAIDRPAARNDPNVPRFSGDALPAWQHVVEEVHAAGGRIAPQLWHVGEVANPRSDWVPPGKIDSPSGGALGQPMSENDIADTIAAYGQAAAAARDIGFDAVEIHAAHGYLIDQFFWVQTNRRKDEWGGPTLPERSRFAVEIVKAVRQGVGLDFPVIIRLSQWKQQDYTARLATNPDEMRAWLEPLAEAGVDAFHCSQRRYWETEFADSELNFAGWAKKLTGRPSITVGSIGLSGEFLSAFRGDGSTPAPLDNLLRRLEREEFDMVAVGRALLTDWEWAIKIRDGLSSELRPFAQGDMSILF